ncbi:MAG: bifunctional proline dehydrogenase/L-glutamate gamma-semialdehyde dehydrogenase PutA [Candidatus Polarisedimenticolaceae bacterium]|nr:bifunctional proline dehydrogenase/L-glutamate gamma-semialdehyde dehydrogenase PutA [Candidatus Polarisedimenticolaceae bacterium]
MPSQHPELERAIRQNHRCDETKLIQRLTLLAHQTSANEQVIQTTARQLVKRARTLQSEEQSIASFIHEYDLRTEEGVLLMCMAEALLRIPDGETQQRLVNEILTRGHWEEHLGSDSSLLVNASTWGLYFGSQMVEQPLLESETPQNTLQQLSQRIGSKMAHAAMIQAVKLMAEHFVMGAEIGDAIARAQIDGEQRVSFDCLGEAAQCQEDVDAYFAAYRDAIEQVGENSSAATLFDQFSISIKLSALHSRYDSFKQQRVLQELLPPLRELIILAKQRHVQVTLDAEEADHLSLSLQIFESLWHDPAIAGWHGFGLAVQAYQKRALPLLEWLVALAKERQSSIPIRLVKGAYWDSEIKLAQQLGLNDYPVFTRKAATDISYLACANYMLQQSDYIYSQFASHNAHTISWILQAGQGKKFEFQRLHGMGEELYQALYEAHPDTPPCRIYAPVGLHNRLLPYLVRRLLENGANASFVNQMADQRLSDEALVIEPHTRLDQPTNHPLIKPAEIYAPKRINAKGLDLHCQNTMKRLQRAIDEHRTQQWRVTPLINGKPQEGQAKPFYNPADHTDKIGQLVEATAEQVDLAYQTCQQSLDEWQQLSTQQRAEIINDCADLYEEQLPELMAHIIREGGRTLPDALAEVREAIDFLRYYANQACTLQQASKNLPGPTGEQNQLALCGRGVIACISPWNFPLAIFTGQIAAALVIGNAVVAKPASATPLTAFSAVKLMHLAGLPSGVLQLLPGDSRIIGNALIDNPALAGIAFTGSLSGAQLMNRSLANRQGAILPLIAETGGINVMIADSSALLDQLIPDLLTSAFNSAGQRCSALRVLIVQEEIADTAIDRLCKCIDELSLGDPTELATDIGPVISEEAQQALQTYCDKMSEQFTLLHKAPYQNNKGHFMPPHLFEIPNLQVMTDETFGPVLHLLRYKRGQLPQMIKQINAMGYGLTLGLHSRLQSTIQRVKTQAKVGNIYINRNMIGAVVGSQPFGGEGTSGTGPKAGGPNYLQRFAHERTVSINTTAIGGDAELLSGK